MSANDITLDGLRRQLNALDRRLLTLVAQRRDLSGEVARVKQATGFPTRDYQREREVICAARSLAQELHVSPALAEELLRLLIRASLTTQEQARVHADGMGAGRRALVIGGCGRMGRWFVGFLAAQGFSVEVADPVCRCDDNGSEAGVHVDDWRKTDLRHEYIVVATHLTVTNTILQELATRAPRGVIFDICSLKSPLDLGFRALQSRHCQVTSIHPLFGPDTELLSGRHVLFVDVGCESAVRAARELFVSTMVEQIVTSAQDHDRLIAYVHGLPHALNIALSAALADVERSVPETAPVSGIAFDALLEAASRAAQESPQAHYEIQSLNHYGTESLSALATAIERVRNAVIARDPDTFAALMHRVQDCLDNRRTLMQRRGLSE